ncbi:hypothetical protein DIPPA_21433 [Diplonema papillatum]|nr:hypothetical protein DIPPA_21433 [Diplonema papillatum]
MACRACLLCQLTGPVLAFPVDDLVLTVNATILGVLIFLMLLAWINQKSLFRST